MGNFRVAQDEHGLFWVERASFSQRDFGLGLPCWGWVHSGGPFRTRLQADDYIHSIMKGTV